DHPNLGTAYNNVGSVHYCLDHYDLALDHYNRSLKIRLKSLPAQHPDISMTYENMGLVVIPQLLGAGAVQLTEICGY
ncbi:unnamed protein product, partial [Rotaria magnacalcarata]